MLPHRDPKCLGIPVAQQPGHRGCHLGLPAVRSQVPGRFGAVPAPPDASQCHSQARHKVHALRQGVGDKCPQGNGGVTTTSPCLCHRDLASGGAELGPGVPGQGPHPAPGAEGCADAPGSARPRWDIDCRGQDRTRGWPGWGQADRARPDAFPSSESGHGLPAAAAPGASPGQDGAGRAALGSSGTGERRQRRNARDPGSHLMSVLG